MCIGVPGKIIELDEYTALVDVLGSRIRVGTLLLSDFKVGDYVIVHAGQAMAVVDEEFARLSLQEWRKIADERLD